MNGIIPFMYYDRKIKTMRYNEYLRNSLDPFNISDRCFVDNYRLPKHLVHQLIHEIEPFVGNMTNLMCIPLYLEVLASLNFYASGSHQRRVGLDAFAVMSQSKISSSITRISKIIGRELAHHHIIVPATMESSKIQKDNFFNKYGVPGIVGLIDCTHIAIANICKKDEYAYINRKNFQSINTQMVCDLDMRILTVNVRYPGSTHDSHIWNGSKILSVVKRLSLEDNKTWLFSDSGYALKPFDDQLRFNKIHTHIRSIIERCFGILKSRFRCLKRTSGHLHYTHGRAANIIYSCAVLHNILVDNNYPMDDLNEVEEDEIVPVPNAEDEENSGEENRLFLTHFVRETNI